MFNSEHQVRIATSIGVLALTASSLLFDQSSDKDQAAPKPIVQTLKTPTPEIAVSTPPTVTPIFRPPPSPTSIREATLQALTQDPNLQRFRDNLIANGGNMQLLEAQNAIGYIIPDEGLVARFSPSRVENNLNRYIPWLRFYEDGGKWSRGYDVKYFVDVTEKDLQQREIYSRFALMYYAPKQGYSSERTDPKAERFFVTVKGTNLDDPKRPIVDFMHILAKPKPGDRQPIQAQFKEIPW